MEDSLTLSKGQTYRYKNGTDIDGIEFVVKEVIDDCGQLIYVVWADHPPIFMPQQLYYIHQAALDAYHERGQVEYDAV